MGVDAWGDVVGLAPSDVYDLTVPDHKGAVLEQEMG